jgi:hypothetical protein
LSFPIIFNQNFISTADAVSGWYLGAFLCPSKNLIFFKYTLYWSHNEAYLCLHSEPMNKRINYSFCLSYSGGSVISTQTFLVICVFA